MNSHRLLRRIQAPLALTLACALLPLSAGAQRAGRTALEALVPVPQAAEIDLGPLPAGMDVQADLYLAPGAPRAAALDDLLAGQADPSSAQYHHWLTPSQFGERFGAEPEQIAAVRSFAESQGLAVTKVSANGLQMTVRGTAAQIESAFNPALHAFQIGSLRALANTSRASVPDALASSVRSISGFNTLPSAATTRVTADGSAATGDVLTPFANVIALNSARVLTLESGACSASIGSADAATLRLLAKAASAQGITLLARADCTGSGSASFAATLPEVTSVATAPALAQAIASSALAPRPAWQIAAGLPQDGLRAAPDFVVSSLGALSDAVQAMLARLPAAAGATPTRLGNINGLIYSLALRTDPRSGLFTQPDAAAPGTWEPLTGLGTIDLGVLGGVTPNGVNSTYVSISSDNYSPTHGKTFTLTSNVSDTSGKTGGAVATGTVTFTDSNGSILGGGPVTLVNGTAMLPLNNIPGGPLTVKASYSGDANYAANTSPTITLTVQAEAATFTATATGSTQLGNNIPVTVTVSSPSGVGTPTGTVTAQLQGVLNAAQEMATLTGANGTATATLYVPATIAGNVQINVTCQPVDPSFTCYQTVVASATVTPGNSSTKLQVSPYPVNTGNGTETFTATVTGAASPSPVPSGNVDFLDNGSKIGSGQLSNGTATFTGSNINVTGSHNFTATYNGDNNYLSSTSVGVNGGATGVGTTTVLVLSTPTPVYGTATTLTATVANAGAAAAPTGSVYFYEDSSFIGAAAVAASGQAAFTSTTISGTAPHTFYAVYQGDAVNAGSQSPTITSTAGNTGTSATATTLTVATSTPTQGMATTLTATVTVTGAAKSAAPTGTVSFYSQTSGLLGSAALNGGSATASVTYTVAGAQAVYAIYSGDTNYSASTSATQTVTVQPSSGTGVTTSVTLTPPANPVQGTALTLTATVAVTGTAKATPPTGTVNFYSSTTQGLLGSTSLVGTTASTSVVFTMAGAQSVYAVYLGDVNYAAATSQPVAVTVAASSAGANTTTTTVQFSTSTPTQGTALTVSATVTNTGTAKSALPSGAVTFTDSVQGNLGTATLVNGVAQVPVTFTASGPHTVTATYVGDANYSGSSGNSTVTVAAGTAGLNTTTTTVQISSANPTQGIALTVQATVLNSGAARSPAPSGSVSFTDSVQGFLGTATLQGPTAQLPVTFTTAGAHTVTATYAGDTNYSTSTGTQTVTLAPAAGAMPTQSLIVSPAPPIVYGSPVVVTDFLTGITLTSGTAPAGTVTFTVTPAGVIGNNASNITSTTATSGTASFSFVAPAPGTYTVSATCAGTNFTCTTGTGAAATVMITVVKAGTTTTVTATPAAPVQGTPTLLTATIAPVAPSTATNFSGLVTFYDNGVSLGTGTVTGTMATFSTTLNSSTPNVITAVYSGDTNFNTSTSPAVNLVVPTTVTTGILTTNLNRALYTTNIILTATISSTPTATTPNPATPYGTVTFYDLYNGQQTTLGTGTLVSSGAYLAIAQLSTTGLLAGQHTVTAIFAGSATFTGVTSNAVAINITDYAVTFTPPTLTLSRGSSGAATATITAINAFNGTVVLGCTPPSGTATTCSFNPAVVATSGTSTLTIQTTAPQAHATLAAGLRYTGFGVSTAALLGFLLWPRRRRPALLVVMALFGLLGAGGCTNIRDTGGSAVGTGGSSGTPLGTQTFTITTSGTDGVTTNRHNLQFQVTVQ